jgi:hypothetical protein
LDEGKGKGFIALSLTKGKGSPFGVGNLFEGVGTKGELFILFTLGIDVFLSVITINKA